MSTKKSTITLKFKSALQFVLGGRNTDFVYTSCEFCGSPRIDVSDKIFSESKEYKSKWYEASYTCRNCGATAEVKQSWKQGE